VARFDTDQLVVEHLKVWDQLDVVTDLACEIQCSAK
jgi:hypothetical protein